MKSTLLFWILAALSFTFPVARYSVVHEKQYDFGEVNRFAPSIMKWSKVYGLEPSLVAAVIKRENPWMAPWLRGSSGEYGLMQVMPFHSPTPHRLAEVDYNIQIGCRELRKMIDRKGSLLRGISAYNTGPNSPYYNIKGYVRGTPDRKGVLDFKDEIDAKTKVRVKFITL